MSCTSLSLQSHIKSKQSQPIKLITHLDQPEYLRIWTLTMQPHKILPCLKRNTFQAQETFIMCYSYLRFMNHSLGVKLREFRGCNKKKKKKWKSKKTSYSGVGDLVKFEWIINTEKYNQIFIQHAIPCGKDPKHYWSSVTDYLKKLEESLLKTVQAVLKNRGDFQDH